MTEEEQTFITKKYNELPFNRRHYSLFNSIADSPIASVQELKHIVLDDWHVIERKAFVYEKADPIEFFRPADDDINMTLNSTGQWVIGRDSTATDELPRVSVTADERSTSRISEVTPGEFDEDDDMDIESPRSPRIVEPPIAIVARIPSANQLTVNNLSAVNNNNNGGSYLQRVRSTSSSSASTGNISLNRPSLITSGEAVTRKSFLGNLFKGDRKNSVLKQNQSNLSSSPPTSPDGQSIANRSSMVEKSTPKESVSEQLEKKPVNDLELNSIEPLTDTSYLGKHLDLKDPTRILSVHDQHFEYAGGKERTSCRRKRQVIEPYASSRKQYFIFQHDSIKIDCGMWEPLFCRVYLYDIANDRKVSEDFSYHLNTPSELKLLDEKIRTALSQIQQDNIYEKATAMFQVSDSSPDIHMVVWIERVLQGNLDDAIKVYENNGKAKKDKVLKKSLETIKCLSHFRQPFLFGSFNIFAREQKNIVLQDGIRTVKFRKLGHISSKEVFDIKKFVPDNETNLDTVVDWISMKVELKSCDKDALNDMFMAYQQAKHKIDSKMNPIMRQRNQRKTRYPLETSLFTFFPLIDDFPLEVQLTPILEFKNTLYVYPDTADLSFAAYKHSTFVIECTLRQSDSLNAEKVVCFADPNHPDGLVASALSSVTKYERAPRFLNEFRVEVPVNVIGSQCHLFFEIYAVKTNTFSAKPHEFGYAQLIPVGFAFVSAFNASHAFLRDGHHSLQIYTKLQDGYISDDSKCSKAKSSFLNIRTRHASTVFMQDNNAAAFMHSMDQIYKITSPLDDINRKENRYFDSVLQMLNEANKNIPKVTDINFIEVLQHTHVILRTYCAVLQRCRKIDWTQDDFDNYESDDELMFLHNSKKLIKQLRVHLFDSLLVFLHGVTAVEGRRGRENKTLSIFVDIFFENNPEEDEPFYQIILDEWITFIDRCDPDSYITYNHKFDDIFQKNADRRRKSWTRISSEKKEEIKSPILANLINRATTQTGTDNTASSTGIEEDDSISTMDSLNFSWFFFELVIKSLLLERQNKKPSSESLEQLKIKLTQLIQKICPLLLACSELRKTKGVLNDVARRFNYELALLLRDLIQFTGRDFVGSILDVYFEQMSLEENDDRVYAKSSFVLDFGELFAEYEGYAGLFVTHKDQQEKFVHSFVEHVICGMKQEQGDLRLKSVHTFKKHLTKIDFDKCLDKDRELKQCVMKPYFKFVELFLRDTSAMQVASNIHALMDIILCFYHVVANTSEEELITFLESHQPALDSLCEVSLITAVVSRKHENRLVKANLVKLYPALFQNVVINKFFAPFAEKFKPIADSMAEEFRRICSSSEPSVTEEEALNILMNNNDISEEITKAVSLFDRCSYFMVNLMLQRSAYDSGTFIELVKRYVHKFIKEFKSFYLLSRIVRIQKSLSTFETPSDSKNKHIPKYEATDSWKMMVASVLVNTATPLDYSVSKIRQCLEMLLDLYHFKQELSFNEETTNQESEKVSEKDDKDAPDGPVIIPESFYNYWSEKDRHMIKAATFRKLVERLFVNNPNYTPAFNDCFFLTHFSVATSTQVLQEIRSITYEIKDSKDVAQRLTRIVNAMKSWVAEHFDEMDASFISSLIFYIITDLSKVMRDSFESSSHKPLQTALLRKLMNMQSERIQQRAPAIPPLVPEKFKAWANIDLSIPFDLTDWDATEIAQQLTLIDHKWFMNIRQHELVSKKKTFDHPDPIVRRATAPNVHLLATQFNTVARWVETCILRKENLDERVLMLKKFFDVLEKLFDIGNFHSCNAVRCGFRSNSINRLKQTWLQVPQIEERLNKYDSLFKFPYENLLKEYEQRLPPCVPFMSQITSEITMAQGAPKYVREVGPKLEKMINYDRMRALTRAIERLKLKQQSYYSFVSVPYLTHHLTNLSPDLMDDDTAFSTSLKLA